MWYFRPTEREQPQAGEAASGAEKVPGLPGRGAQEPKQLEQLGQQFPEADQRIQASSELGRKRGRRRIFEQVGERQQRYQPHDEPQQTVHARYSTA